MQALHVCVLLVALCCAAQSKTLIFDNKLTYTIWVGSQGNSGKPPLNNGGWTMNAGSQLTMDVADDYAGRVWARTGCNFDGAGNGFCETGDCGGTLECVGKGGTPPVTLAEFTFNGADGKDFYDISLVDGYNVPSHIIPTDNFGGGDMYWCQDSNCPSTTINTECPDELRKVIDGRTVACMSACFAFDTDQYCCRGAYGTPETCKASDWPVNYPAFFKERCPLAYSYAYDDQQSTFTCINTGYRIQFG